MAFSPSPTSADPVSSEAVLAALERVLHSDGFRKTPSLRHLLHYLVTKSLEGHPEQIKESIIAIDVFSRREDFDGRIDNIVRVQAHRLRKLLETYYSEQGLRDPLRISVPKGSYVPQFEPIAEETLPAETPRVITPLTETAIVATPASEPKTKRRFPVRIALAFAAGVALTAAVFQLGVLPRAASLEPPAPPVREIWSPVFGTGVKVIAAYSNPAFLRVGHLPMLIQYNGLMSAPPEP